MLEWYRIMTHTVTSCKVHLVWCTKYKYKVLKWEIQRRCRDIIRQTCKWMDIVIFKVSGKFRLHTSGSRISTKVVNKWDSKETEMKK